jgi:plasmid stability protein
MASMTIRNLDEETKRRLRLRAAANGHSLEAEARDILKRGATEAPSARPRSGQDLFTKIRRLVEPFGGIDLVVPARASKREIPFQKKKRATRRPQK